MSVGLYFMIVGRNDFPLFEAELSGNTKRDESRQYILQFVMYASLDVIDEIVWSTQAMNLKMVDRYNDLYVAAYNTAGNVRFLLLTDQKGNEDAIKNFFQEVHELYLKACLNPFHSTAAPMKSPVFAARVKASAKKVPLKEERGREGGGGGPPPARSSPPPLVVTSPAPRSKHMIHTAGSDAFEPLSRIECAGRSIIYKFA